MKLIMSLLSASGLMILYVLLGLLFVRAILSLFAPDGDHPLINFVFNVTDIVLAPARYIIDKTGFMADSMFDIAYMITVVVLWLLTVLFMLF